MTAIEPLQHRAAWTPQTLSAAPEAWNYRWTDEDVAELDHALQRVTLRGLVVPRITR